jgi:hypothetical protein
MPQRQLQNKCDSFALPWCAVQHRTPLLRASAIRHGVVLPLLPVAMPLLRQSATV